MAESLQAAKGYAPLMAFPVSGVYYHTGVAVDSAGNVFITGSYQNRIVELAKTAAGYGPRTDLPVSGLYASTGIAVGIAGNIFFSDSGHNREVELPRTSTGTGHRQSCRPLVEFPLGSRRGHRREYIRRRPQRRPLSQSADRILEFDNVTACTPSQTTPAPCGERLTLNFNVNADLALGTPRVFIDGADPRLHSSQRKHLHRRGHGGHNLHRERALRNLGRRHTEWLG